jgi:diguanylate cyclase (GGDEF)-like protein
MPSSRLKLFTCASLSKTCVTSLEASAEGPFEVKSFTDCAEAMGLLIRHGCDALLLDSGAGADAQSAVRDLVAAVAAQTATLIVTVNPSPATALDWLRSGVQDVLAADELTAPLLARRIRAAIERKRLERDARKAYATDLDTGLPHQQQLIEHMSHLLALREREPSPMAVLALRIEGLATTEARLGREASNVLRRRVAVRLRAGVRASDVVASIGDDQFAVLLGALLTADDAQRVGAKLMAALMKPFSVAGKELAVAAALGIGQYPQDGTQPDVLLRRAVGLAAAAQAQGRAGFANFVEAGGQAPDAANDA